MVPIKGMKTVPAYRENDLLTGAFLALVSFAFREDEIAEQYNKETGFNIRRIIPNSPLAAMIDKACGYDGNEDFAAFADWVNVNLWGEEGKGCAGKD